MAWLRREVRPPRVSARAKFALGRYQVRWHIVGEASRGLCGAEGFYRDRESIAISGNILSDSMICRECVTTAMGSLNAAPA